MTNKPLDLKSTQFQELLHKYAKVMLVNGPNLDPGQPIVIEIEKNMLFFADIIKEEAAKIGVTDVTLNVRDLEKERKLYLTKNPKEFKTDKEVIACFERSKTQKCYENDGAVLYIGSRSPLALADIDSKLQDEAYDIRYETSKEAEIARLNYEFPWLIARLADKPWADLVFPNDPNSLEKLWDAFFKVTHIYDEDPVKSWNEKVKRNNARAKLLTDLDFKKLHYKNSLGTNLDISLPENHIWLSSGKKQTGKDKIIVCNMPTEEIFTAPDFKKTEGVVYASKPLVLNGKLIEDLCLTFKNGEVVDVKAKTNLEEIKRLITIEGANVLGEVALVDNNSPISQTGILFYDTLFDENAACHLALGTSFPTTIQNGNTFTTEELLERGLNVSVEHEDFMIGTPDLDIVGTTKNGETYQIFENGNFVLDKQPKVLKIKK